MKRALLFLFGAAVAAAPPAESITKTADGGPIKATITLSPAKPRLGDQLTLTLTVDAEPGVNVQMPAFGEALGRFAIVEFVPGAPRRQPDGKSRIEQRYVLESPPSGKQRIPALRIEFLDERPGQAAADAGGTRELLTEEIPVEIAGINMVGQSGTGDARADAPLKPPRAALSEDVGGGLLRWPVLAGAGVPLLLVAGFLLLRAARRRAAERARVNAFDVAMGRLAALERRGFPKADDADAWYVELSGIVRRYIEDRFAIRAPELTSEEFLHVARRSPELGEAHATLLIRFLAACDRVKFAGYHPDDSESAGALGSARSFLGETKLASARAA